MPVHFTELYHNTDIATYALFTSRLSISLSLPFYLCLFVCLLVCMSVSQEKRKKRKKKKEKSLSIHLRTLHLHFSGIWITSIYELPHSYYCSFFYCFILYFRNLITVRCVVSNSMSTATMCLMFGLHFYFISSAVLLAVQLKCSRLWMRSESDVLQINSVKTNNQKGPRVLQACSR